MACLSLLQGITEFGKVRTVSVSKVAEANHICRPFPTSIHFNILAVIPLRM